MLLSISRAQVSGRAQSGGGRVANHPQTVPRRRRSGCAPWCRTGPPPRRSSPAPTASPATPPPDGWPTPASSTDPAIDEDDLRELYVTQQLTTREVAAKLGRQQDPESCGRSHRRDPGQATRVETASYRGDGCRRGQSPRWPARRSPHHPVRHRRTSRPRFQPPGPPSRSKPPAARFDLHVHRSGDRHRVEASRHRGSNTHPPRTITSNLYWEIGLSIHQVALLCDVSDATIHRRLRQAGIPLRPATQPSPWNQRRLSGEAPPGTNRGTSTTHPNKNSTLDRTPREEQ